VPAPGTECEMEGQISGPGAVAAGVGKRDGFDEADPVAASLQQQQNIPTHETDNGLEGDSDPATEELQQSGNGLDESEVSNFKPVPAAIHITHKNVTETSTGNEPKKTVGTLPTKKKAGTLRRSNCH
jgi:hypothetical protein